MNILLINHFGGFSGQDGISPETAAWGEFDDGAGEHSSLRHHSLAREWVKTGHHVTIAAASFVHTRAEEFSGDEVFEHREYDGVNYIFVRARQYRPNERLRFLNMLDFLGGLSRSAETIAAKLCPDVVIAASAYPLDIYPAKKIARCSGAKLVYEMRFIQPDYMVETGRVSQYGPLAFAIRRAATKAARDSDKIISTLLSADEWLRTLGAQNKLVYLAEAADPFSCKPSPAAKEIISELHRLRGDAKFVTAYVGLIDSRSNLEPLLLSASEIGSDCAVVFVGNGGHKVILRRIARDKKINNAYFFDGVTEAESQAVMEAASCNYAGAPSLSVSRFGVSAQAVLRCMLAGRPVVCASEAPPAPLAKTGCGLAADPKDSRSVATAIVKLKGFTADELDEMGRAGRSYVLERHSYEKLAQRYMRVLSELLGERS